MLVAFEQCKSKNTLYSSALQYNMTNKQHTISLHILSVVPDISRNVPQSIRCLDDSISLLCPETSLKQLSEPSHRCKIVFHKNSL